MSACRRSWQNQRCATLHDTCAPKEKAARSAHTSKVKHCRFKQQICPQCSCLVQCKLSTLHLWQACIQCKQTHWLMVLLGSSRHVSAIDVQFCVWQLLSYGWPDVLTQPLDPIPIRRVLPVANCHEVQAAAERLRPWNSFGEERSIA